MGNIVSCCSLDESKKYVNDDEILETFSNAEISEFKNRLKNNIQIVVLLQDGTKLPCNLQANFAEKTLCISCHQKVRMINFSDIRSLLYGEEQLKRVETQANLISGNCCLALHLDDSGNCIPIKFEAMKDKNLFIYIMRDYKKN
ncbi:inner membrane complex sub-compartment protein 1, putative [Plasmodium chabaudi chabaudi]|uniref:Inner membrane complex sub-compartment protein 1, putative n=2 Tax=Plasmodium chabaudi TaxID=5825 RepID=A0A077TMM5_PLACU|nr:inner membrane complex sub-compartment protein 1, putative [Plasmodium chabaudi chabaudi]SCM23010.1 inner membrane complex sub-compartment protein 1, putative [Plasmodium chabaudi adami]SCM24423.1 inner membrane complex sub-compartment protein 1, putative [Plasmodium chabaudi chabaudi]SCN61851.1 inner membrane complex sub-compartment protein 1, putative [Plasmodium chabaudi chabaudi]VTZ69572.1 inner membrane complex sub-compartment protein 1, putative [Plasmodium chabaudi chabaudi]|eukprot:XP_016654192.1 inner membrane complex sub-compartment protein 1, putative [Plasmodium chabaudi chabaudi]